MGARGFFRNAFVFIFFQKILLNLFGEWNSNKETSEVNAI
jgi:hypothetical protein